MSMNKLTLDALKVKSFTTLNAMAKADMLGGGTTTENKSEIVYSGDPDVCGDVSPCIG